MSIRMHIPGPSRAGEANTYAIALSGLDVYRGGYDGDKAVYWKDLTPMYLTDGTQPSSVRGIAVAGGDLYVVGTANGIATFWKNNIGMSSSDGSVTNSEARSVFVYVH